MALPTIKLVEGESADITLVQSGLTADKVDLSTYDRIEVRSEDAGLVWSSANASECELVNSNFDILIHFAAFAVKNIRYAYWVAGVSGANTTDLAGKSYIVIREEA